MEIAPISASMGAMGSLTEKLDGLMDSELKDEIWKLKARLYDLSKIWDPPLRARRWMKDVRGLSYEMENCVDAETDWFDKISRFKVRAKDSNGRYDRYDLQDVLNHTNHIEPIVGHRLPAVDSDREPDPVVGLHGEGGTVDRLSHLLTDGDEQLKVLSIIGVGGIGKTTLAKELWRKHKPGNHFHCRAFVRMAKKPDMRRILRSILAQVRPHQPPDADEVQELIEDIREHLQDKRYFLIIDDLWATSVWDVARRAFPEGKGSRILTMTEIEDVALACCSYQSDYFFEMNPLSDSHSKELFTSAVFGSVEEYSSQLDEVSDEIIRRCAGLPQAIISVSSVLASQWEAYTVQNMEEILKNLPTNTTPNNILKQVLNFCYNYLPSSLQTCLLYLSMYPENYIFLKEDIMKQWVAEGFILAPTESEKMKVAGNYFDKLVKMGLIQHIDVDYSDEVLYYLVHHMVHDFITSKSIEENFISVIDYLQRTLRLSNKVSRLSVQFGSATYATTLPSVGLSQVRSLAFIGLKNCLPPISEFKVLRSLILHIWADQPSTGVDLKPTYKLVLLRSMQVTCNGTVHLPDLMQGPKNLETLEINAIVAAIPANIVHLRNWLHLRLGVGTELPDLTGILRNVTLNAPILLDELSSPADTVTTVELLSPISRIPKWTRQLINLCILKLVVKELQMDDINKLQKLPFLTILSLHVQRRTTEVIDFTPGEFVTLEYFEFRCSVLRLMFQKGTMPNLQRLRLGFNACRGEQYGCQLAGIEHLSNVQEIYGIIGSVAGAQEDDLKAAEHAFKEAIGLDHRNFNMKRVNTVEEEDDHAEKQYVIREKNASIKQPAVLEQDSKKDINQNASSGEAAEHAFKEATGEDHSNVNMIIVDMVEKEYGHTDEQQVIREKDASVRQPALLEQDSKKDINQNASSGPQLIQRKSNNKVVPNVVQENQELGSTARVEVNMEEERQNILGRRNIGMDLTLNEIETITNNFSEDQKVGSGRNGCVYKAVYNGQEIAVKKLYGLQGIDDKQFHSESLNLYTKVSHKNVVQLIGYCYGTRNIYLDLNGENIWAKLVERVLCSEYMQCVSLDKHISDESCRLDWPTCYDIIRGISEGLNHLHNAHKKPIYHLALKPANILLDKSMTPKISDLGLSRVFALSESHMTMILRVTPAYMPLEYTCDGLISNKFDVFSFGVIIIKMVAGNIGYLRYFVMPPKEFIKLVTENWTKRLHAMPGLYSSHEIAILQVNRCAEIALRCVDNDRAKRPRIQDIVQELEELEAEIKKMSVTSDLSKDKTVQRSCDSNVVSVDPTLELLFLFERRKEASSCLQITNKTDGFIAFKLNIDQKKYRAQPRKGTMPPWSKRYAVVTMEAQEKAPPNMQSNDMLLVQSTSITQEQASGLDGIDYHDLFETDMVGKVVDVVKLPIVYITLDQLRKN